MDELLNIDNTIYRAAVTYTIFTSDKEFKDSTWKVIIIQGENQSFLVNYAGKIVSIQDSISEYKLHSSWDFDMIYIHTTNMHERYGIAIDTVDRLNYVHLNFNSELSDIKIKLA